MSLLAVDKLSVSFGAADVVKEISFGIGKGEFLALVGESGSGKSLTALSILGLQPDTAKISGSAQFGGEEILGAPEPVLRSIRGKKIAMIFQEPMTALNPLHTIGKQIGEMISTHNRVSAAEVKEQVAALLDQVGLDYLKDRLGSYPHQLSGGERQRVMISMAIANKPDLLIADEPTTAVDVTIQVKILALLKELQKSMGMAILFITHDLTIVRRLADRVAVMSKGEIVEQGVVKDIFAAPKHPYTKHLLESEPKGLPEKAAGDAKALLEGDDIKVYFPIRKGVFRRTAGYVKAVDGVSLSIPESSTLGVVGESGSGKSTLGFALLKLVGSEGKIVFAGQDISPLPAKAMRPLRKEMQLVFQDPFSSLNPRMNIRQILAEGLMVHFAMSEAEREKAIDTILDEVGLPADTKTRYPHEFSGGQRQRISIARAMILKPKFMVLDEPTSALDLTVQAQIIALLKDLQKTHKLSYLFISHDLRVVRAIAQKLLVMRHGKVVEAGDTEAVFAAPKQDYTKALIDAAFLKNEAVL